VDGAPHREGLPVVYLQYERVNEATAGNLDRLCVLRPLFLTSFLIADLLLDEQRDVDRVLVTSASSKTAIALAQVLRVQRGEKLGSHSTKLRLVGVTSARNAEFVRSLENAYDEVILYDDLEKTCDASASACLVDIAGNASVRQRIHQHWGDALKLSLGVGLTHHDAPKVKDEDKQRVGPKAIFFFAPTQAVKVIKRVGGPEAFFKCIASYWITFVAGAETWLKIVHHKSALDISRAVSDMVSGTTSPSQAVIISIPSRL